MHFNGAKSNFCGFWLVKIGNWATEWAIYTLIKIALKGQVTVACDRCLDPLTLNVDTSDTLKIKDAEPEDCDADDLLYLDAGNPCYDLSWVTYEIIETSLPMQRVHAAGKCNKEVVSYIIADDNEDEDNEDF